LINLSDFKPFIIKDILTQKEYDYVYECVNSGFPEIIKADLPPDSRQHVEYLNVPDLGYLAYVKGFNKEFYKSLQDSAEKAIGIKLNTPQVHFARYTNKTGFPPKLIPHYDLALVNSSITFSIQMDSTLDWELCAYDTCETLSKNEALVFSGSHQIHWRPPINFSENDYFDIMVVQLPINYEEFPSDHVDKMNELAQSVGQEYVKKYSKLKNVN
jgi:hypothetical protein